MSIDVGMLVLCLKGPCTSKSSGHQDKKENRTLLSATRLIGLRSEILSLHAV
jgi:hypothetical protein